MCPPEIRRLSNTAGWATRYTCTEVEHVMSGLQVGLRGTLAQKLST